MIIFNSKADHKVIKKTNNIIVNFQKPMLCYSTSQLNGGINTLTTCFNHQLTEWIANLEELPNGNIHDYFKKVAEDLNLNHQTTSGLMTTASIDNVAVSEASFKKINVFSVVTAGVNVNAVRAGDPASYYEEPYQLYTPLGGTINIILVIEANLPIEGLTRIPIIVTEAKASILQDLNIKSCFSEKTATGTGTDGLIIACHKKDETKFSDVGNHSKLGELISLVTRQAIKEALEKQDGIERKLQNE